MLSWCLCPLFFLFLLYHWWIINKALKKKTPFSNMIIHIRHSKTLPWSRLYWILMVTSLLFWFIWYINTINYSSRKVCAEYSEIKMVGIVLKCIVVSDKSAFIAFLAWHLIYFSHWAPTFPCMPHGNLQGTRFDLLPFLNIQKAGAFSCL